MDVELLQKFRGYVQVSIINKVRDASYHVRGLLEIMNKDADKIDLAFLSDKVVELSMATLPNCGGKNWPAR